MKTTPGPWFKQGSQITATPTGKRFVIAEVMRDSVATCHANARLIAAAPELAEALRAILWKVERKESQSGNGGDCKWATIDRNDATIANARAVLSKLEEAK